MLDWTEWSQCTTSQNTVETWDKAPFHGSTNPLPSEVFEVCTIKSVRKHFRRFTRISKKYTQALKHLPGRECCACFVRNVCGPTSHLATTRPPPGSPGHDVVAPVTPKHRGNTRASGPRRGSGQTQCWPVGGGGGPTHPMARPINQQAALCESVPLKKVSGKKSAGLRGKLWQLREDVWLQDIYFLTPKKDQSDLIPSEF